MARAGDEVGKAVETVGEEGGKAEASRQEAGAYRLGTEAADEVAHRSGPAARNSQDDGGDANVDRAYATPERICKDQVAVVETDDGRQAASLATTPTHTPARKRIARGGAKRSYVDRPH